MRVLGNSMLPRLYGSRKHSQKDVPSVNLCYRKMFSYLNILDQRRNSHNASLPVKWLSQVNFTLPTGWASWIKCRFTRFRLNNFFPSTRSHFPTCNLFGLLATFNWKMFGNLNNGLEILASDVNYFVIAFTNKSYKIRFYNSKLNSCKERKCWFKSRNSGNRILWTALLATNLVLLLWRLCERSSVLVKQSRSIEKSWSVLNFLGDQEL